MIDFYNIKATQYKLRAPHVQRHKQRDYESSEDVQRHLYIFSLRAIRLTWGFWRGWHFKENGFDGFYEQLGMNISESFNWEAQDGDQGEVVLRKLYPERDFCFVHDDPSRGYHINPQTDLPIVRNTIQSQTIFDYLPLLREAKEIHCMDSSFALMIDRSDIPAENLFIHRKFEKEVAFLHTKREKII